jgi:hypothetical protein
MTTRVFERAIVLATFSLLAQGAFALTTVNCGIGQTISSALAPGAVIEIKGTCKENVVITQDDVTLKRVPGSAKPRLRSKSKANKSAIVIDGARRVTLTGLQIVNSLNGIVATNGATFTLGGSIVKNNKEHGVVISDNARGEIKNSDVEFNGADGISVQDGAHANIHDNSITDNGQATPPDAGRGVVVNDGASADIKRNDITDNSSDGIGVFNGAYARVEDNDIERNGRLAVFEGGLQVSRAVVRANGNRYNDNAYAAIAVYNDGSYRTGTFLNAVDNPDNLFPFEVINQGTGQLAVELSRMVLVDLRQVTVTGDITLGHNSVLQIRGDNVGPVLPCSTVNGNIDAFGIFSLVRLRNVDVTGVVNVGVDSREFVTADCSPPPP